MSDTNNPFGAFAGLGSENNAKNPFEQASSTQQASASILSPLVDIGEGEGVGNPFTPPSPQSPSEVAPAQLFEVTAPSEPEAEEEPSDGDSEETPDDEPEGEDEAPAEEGDAKTDTDKTEADDGKEVENPLMAAIEGQEQQNLFGKLPVFVLGNAREDIENLEQTFDELREEKARDFPELVEPKYVSWEVSYGGVKKYITSVEAKKTKIGKCKQDIETSKDFIAKLKKSKDKNPTCEVKPKVIGQSKGEALSSYRGVFCNMEEAENSGKTICFVPGDDGNVYEIRSEEMGRFITPSGKTQGLSEIKAGFIPALPQISSQQLLEIITFFRSFMSKDGNYEAIANIFWDRVDKVFVTVIPKQSVSRDTADSELPDDFDTARYLHYMDVHSHNVMAAKFSDTDNRDERATRLYAVIGKLNQYLPQISVRISNGGKFLNIAPELVFEPLHADYPSEWDGLVRIVQPEPPEESGGLAA